MRDFVSNPWISGVALVPVATIIWAFFLPYGFPWTTLVWGTLAVAVAFYVSMRAGRSLTHVIREVEAEPTQAAPKADRSQ